MFLDKEGLKWWNICICFKLGLFLLNFFFFNPTTLFFWWLHPEKTGCQWKQGFFRRSPQEAIRHVSKGSQHTGSSPAKHALKACLHGMFLLSSNTSKMPGTFLDRRNLEFCSSALKKHSSGELPDCLREKSDSWSAFEDSDLFQPSFAERISSIYDAAGRERQDASNAPCSAGKEPAAPAPAVEPRIRRWWDVAPVWTIKWVTSSHLTES